MSQFDYPRIHFSGKTTIDPATGNNNYHFPLVCYEPDSGTVVLPPRIYITSDIASCLVKDLESKMISLLKDEDGDLYIPILPISTPELFKEWMITPIGSHTGDSNYHWIYDRISTQKENKKLAGLHPGYWNYFGTMNFAFENVKIHSIETNTNIFVKDQKVAGELPEEIELLLNAELFFLNEFNKRNAVMIDVSPAMSIFTQIFADKLVIEKNGNRLLTGKPYKGALRHINATRISNKSGIFSSSGVFYTSILFSEAEESILSMFFTKHSESSTEIVGVGIRFDLFGLEENQYPDYQKLGENSNFASTQILGSIYPLRKGELRSANSDRLLIPDRNYSGINKFGSTPFRVDINNNKIQLDLIDAWPLTCVKEKWQTLNFNDFILEFIFQKEKKRSKKIKINNEFSFDVFKNKGGVIELEIPKTKDLRGSFDLCISIASEDKLIRILKEIPIRVISDQTGIYKEEGQNKHGFLNNNGCRKKLTLRVINRGVVSNNKTAVSVSLLKPRSFSKGIDVQVLELSEVSTGRSMKIEETKAGHYFYAFYPLDNNIIPTDIISYMLHTSNYVNLRIIPTFEWDKNTHDVTFDLLYKNFLIDYDLIYPSSGIITPFNQKHFSKINRFLRKIMDESAWGNYLYMPSSRDMPSGKRDLLFRYLEDQNKSLNSK